MLALARLVSVLLVALLFVLGGVNHFRNQAFYVAMMPSWLPAPVGLVQLSGVLEVLGGLGVLLPATRTMAGWGLLALLVAVFPANLNMALHPERWVAGGVPLWGLYLRLPLQALLMAWVWWATRAS